MSLRHDVFSSLVLSCLFLVCCLSSSSAARVDANFVSLFSFSVRNLFHPARRPGIHLLRSCRHLRRWIAMAGDPSTLSSTSSTPHHSAPGSLDRGGIYDGLSFESNIILFPLVQDTQVRLRLRNYIGLTRYVVQACCIRQLGLVLFVLVCCLSLFSYARGC